MREHECYWIVNKATQEKIEYHGTFLPAFNACEVLNMHERRHGRIAMHESSYQLQRVDKSTGKILGVFI